MLASVLRLGRPSHYVGTRALSMMSEDTIRDAFATHGMPCVTTAMDVVVERAEGSWLYTMDGRKVLDTACGIGATNLGHCHPKPTKAVQDAVAEAVHLQQNCIRSPRTAELMVRLNAVTPPELTRFFFNCTGSEAVESAVKLARHATGKPNIVTLQGGFHGRTLGALSLTSSKNVYGIGYGPFLGGIHRVPYPYCMQCKANPSGGVGASSCASSVDFECCGDPIDQLHLLMKQASAPSDTAAVIIEPVLGEGGYVVPPASYMAKLREFCDANEILLIADEVQSGFGRTGKMFACEHFDLVPDILIMAKGMGSGMPIAGIAAKEHLVNNSPPGSMGGTYGCSAPSAASAIATLDVFEEEKVLDNVAARSEQLFGALKDLQAKYPAPQIFDVRGLGLMVGVEFDSADTGVAGRVATAAAKRDLLLLTTGAYETVRLIPPLTISKDEMDMVIERFTGAVDEALSS